MMSGTFFPRANIYSYTINGFVEKIKFYGGVKVFKGIELYLHRSLKGQIIVSTFTGAIGELDPITTNTVDLYWPFAMGVQATCIDLHDGDRYPVEIKFYWKYFLFHFQMKPRDLDEYFDKPCIESEKELIKLLAAVLLKKRLLKK